MIRVDHAKDLVMLSPLDPLAAGFGDPVVVEMMQEGA